jgi:hypothetical protein
LTYSEMRDEAEQKSSNSLAEAVLYMSSITHNSACHAQGGCLGLMRPTRIKDRIVIGRAHSFPDECAHEDACTNSPLETKGSAQGSGRRFAIRHPLEHSLGGQRGHLHSSLESDICAAKV